MTSLYAQPVALTVYDGGNKEAPGPRKGRCLPSVDRTARVFSETASRFGRDRVYVIELRDGVR